VIRKKGAGISVVITQKGAHGFTVFTPDGRKIFAQTGSGPHTYTLQPLPARNIYPIDA
jgi:hypothetical protein